MEAETGRPLDRFFDRWIDGSALPRLGFSYRVDGGDVVLRIEQLGDLFDLPVTVTLQYADRHDRLTSSSRSPTAWWSCASRCAARFAPPRSAGTTRRWLKSSGTERPRRYDR